ncbi:SRPBCC family protein [Streptomyces sp. FR-108]|uniref:SRPBCC family protein n=1 Tax=Streptomyces sp. FR-108 TaxID=3416665 RepID=UPI003CF39E83
MTGAAQNGWPTAELDPLRRLRVLASTTEHSTYAERHFDVPFDVLWAVVSDLEHELPHLMPGLRGFTVTGSVPGSEGERLEGEAVGDLGHRERFEVVLRPGWCLLQSRVQKSGMAAAPDEAGGCTFACFTSPRFPTGELVGRLRGAGGDRRSAGFLDRLEQRLVARSVPGGPEGLPRPEQP